MLIDIAYIFMCTLNYHLQWVMSLDQSNIGVWDGSWQLLQNHSTVTIGISCQKISQLEEN